MLCHSEDNHYLYVFIPYQSNAATHYALVVESTYILLIVHSVYWEGDDPHGTSMTKLPVTMIANVCDKKESQSDLSYVYIIIIMLKSSLSVASEGGGATSDREGE